MKLIGLLDRLVPEREFTRHRRPSDRWFDKQCRVAKCPTRRLERASGVASRRANATTNASHSSAVEIPNRTPPPSLRKWRGTISDAHTVNFVDGNAPYSGPAE